MPQAYEVHPYSISELCRLLAEKASADQHLIDQKRHRVYLEEYFQKLGAKTIVVENGYTDRDFLEDFAGYYVRCFHDYPRRCARLHFFAESFGEGEFARLLSGESTPLKLSTLVDEYLGFIVVKPLPQTVIGRTCLKTYPFETRRFFPIVHSYHANLFGLPLSIDSLPFQEQDSVAAACATSALWSALNGTGKQFQHYVPSPVEITKAATTHVPHDTRTFPNSSGLNATQMADAIRSVGLEPCLVNAANEFNVKSTLYAYLRCGIPILMLIGLYEPPLAKLEDIIARHAVTVTGYSLGNSNPVPAGTIGFLSKATRIDKFYVHDDQIGPFARMESKGGPEFSTSWMNAQGTGTWCAHAELLLIPLYHKIRIPLDIVLRMVSAFDSLLEPMRQHRILNFADRLEWDIFLTNLNILKSELFESPVLSGDHLRNVLTHPMPRFIWRATATSGGTPILDLLFDATDIEQGISFSCAVEYDVTVSRVLRSVAPALFKQPASHVRDDRCILQWFANPPF